MNVRRLQNGIGAASALGIAALLVAMAFESGSSPTLPDPSIAAGPTNPLTSTGDGAPPSGTPSASPATITPSATPTTSSNSSVRQPEHTNNHAGALPNATSSTPPSTGSDPTLPGVVALSTAAGDPPVSGTTTTTTTTTQPPVSAASTTTTTTTTDPSTVPSRQVTGRAVTLGAGTFSGGTDVVPGLYDVTTGPDQSGHFVVNGTESYNETLGTPGVPKIRVQVSNGDQIEIRGLAQVFFTPVSTPFVTSHSPVTLYAGTWTVGQDLGPGRYVATPGSGQSGKFIITAEGVSEVLGGNSSGGEVPSYTFTVKSGDVIEITGLAQVTLAPS